MGCLSGPILSLGVVPVQRYLVLHPSSAPNHEFDCLQVFLCSLQKLYQKKMRFAMSRCQVCKRLVQRLDPDWMQTGLDLHWHAKGEEAVSGMH